jgi:Periplasmic copper-binding protein (NosD)
MRGLLLAVVAAGVALVPGGPASAAPSLPQHSAITIASDADFTSCACVTGGSGTASDPYVIGPWKVTAPSSGGWAIKVDNSGGAVTKFFRIQGLVTSFDDTTAGHALIWLVNVAHSAVAGLTANNDYTGVRLDSSTDITLDGINVNQMKGDGVLANSSTNITIVNSKLKAEHEGLHAVNSGVIRIGVGCKGNRACNAFTYDDGRGIRLDNSHDVTVRSTDISADDTGGILLNGVGTYNADIGFINMGGIGSICEMGEPTGDVTDDYGGIMLTNGAHDNHIHDLTVGGSAGFGIGSGGSGFWVNACTDEIVTLPQTPGMGAGNTFVNVCFQTTNIVGLVRSCP